MIIIGVYEDSKMSDFMKQSSRECLSYKKCRHLLRIKDPTNTNLYISELFTKDYIGNIVWLIENEKPYRRKGKYAYFRNFTDTETYDDHKTFKSKIPYDDNPLLRSFVELKTVDTLSDHFRRH